MKKLILVVLLLLPCVAMAEQRAKYDVAHTRYRDANMVVVIVGNSFFDQDENTQAKWYTAVKACVRSVNMAGQTIVVSESRRGRFLFYGPKDWHPFLRTIDMDWVRARVNKKLTCHF